MKGKSSKTSSFGTVGRVNHDSSKFYDSKLYQGLRTETEPALSDNPLPPEAVNHIFETSCQKMEALPDRSVHLMITSPPYNVSKEYDDDLSLEEYLELLKNCFSETFRVLVHGGRACINVANIGRKPYIPLSDYISRLMLETGFKMRGEIIWNKGAGAGASTAWGSWMSAGNPILRDVHEYILVFSKGDYKREKTSKEKESTITRDQFMEWTKSVWNMNGESAKRIGHPAPFPEELPYRLMQLYSFKGDVVLDPFMGSGTTAAAAVKSGRLFTGYEIVPEYIQLAQNRLEPLLRQPVLV